MRDGDADTNPVTGFQFPKEDSEKPASRVFETDEEQNKLLAALPDWLRLITILALQTGARRGDLVKLTWKSIHANHIEFLKTKEGRLRNVPLNPTARSILAKLRPVVARPDAFVFEPAVRRVTLISRIRRDWKRAQQKAGIAKIRFHDLRHTVGTRLVLRGNVLRTVQQILGHASLKTTERYLHSSDKLKQAAVESLNDGRSMPSAPEQPSTETPITGNIIN